jgi:hypothetical protein
LHSASRRSDARVFQTPAFDTEISQDAASVVHPAGSAASTTIIGRKSHKQLRQLEGAKDAIENHRPQKQRQQAKIDRTVAGVGQAQAEISVAQAAIDTAQAELDRALPERRRQ